MWTRRAVVDVKKSQQAGLVGSEEYATLGSGSVPLTACQPLVGGMTEVTFPGAM